eukprot:10513051-Lingulodinium_polyedra.AAC.1
MDPYHWRAQCIACKKSIPIAWCQRLRSMLRAHTSNNSYGPARVSRSCHRMKQHGLGTNNL